DPGVAIFHLTEGGQRVLLLRRRRVFTGERTGEGFVDAGRPLGHEPVERERRRRVQRRQEAEKPNRRLHGPACAARRSAPAAARLPCFPLPSGQAGAPRRVAARLAPPPAALLSTALACSASLRGQAPARITALARHAPLRRTTRSTPQSRVLRKGSIRRSRC